jgi:hypothetical protein
LAATLKQPTDKSALSNAHHISEQVFESKQARRGVSTAESAKANHSCLVDLLSTHGRR